MRLKIKTCRATGDHYRQRWWCTRASVRFYVFWIYNFLSADIRHSNDDDKDRRGRPNGPQCNKPVESLVDQKFQTRARKMTMSPVVNPISTFGHGRRTTCATSECLDRETVRGTRRGKFSAAARWPHCDCQWCALQMAALVIVPQSVVFRDFNTIINP